TPPRLAAGFAYSVCKPAACRAERLPRGPGCGRGRTRAGNPLGGARTRRGRRLRRKDATMTEVIDQTPPAESPAPPATGLATAAQHVLATGDEPQTVSKIRSRLPGALRSIDLKELTEALDRQVTAGTLYKYPKYRSQQDRYWDRGMTTHVAHLL